MDGNGLLCGADDGRWSATACCAWCVGEARRRSGAAHGKGLNWKHQSSFRCRRARHRSCDVTQQPSSIDWFATSALASERKSERRPAMTFYRESPCAHFRKTRSPRGIVSSIVKGLERKRSPQRGATILFPICCCPAVRRRRKKAIVATGRLRVAAHFFVVLASGSPLVATRLQRTPPSRRK